MLTVTPRRPQLKAVQFNGTTESVHKCQELYHRYVSKLEGVITFKTTVDYYIDPTLHIQATRQQEPICGVVVKHNAYLVYDAAKNDLFVLDADAFEEAFEVEPL